jgi:acyl-CoA thioester hydrolase
MACEFQITRRVEFSDTDMAGIMHFSNFFRFMETAEHAFFRSIGYSVVLSRNGLGFHLPRVHAECHYRAPLKFEDEVRVHLLVQKKSQRSLTYQFRFHRVGDAETEEVARGKVTVVCVKRLADGTLKAAPLPGEIADKIQEAPPHLLANDEAVSRQSTTDSTSRRRQGSAVSSVRKLLKPTSKTVHRYL